MISVLPCYDKNTIKSLFEKHGLITDDFSGCVIARNGLEGETLGYSLYRLDKKSITVYAVEPCGDLMLADGILRSALHVAAENFVLDAFYTDTSPIELFKKLGFIKSTDQKRLDINKLFGGCNCSAKNNG